MGVKCDLKKGAIDAFFDKAIDVIIKYILNALTKLGEECLVKIRDRSPIESWIDHSGNLRSSTGYSVYLHGMQYMKSTFGVVLNGSRGKSEGERMVQELASKYTDTCSLVVLAAMDYADCVEALENKDVLESTRIWATSVVEERLNRAREEALKVINSWEL